MTGEVTDRFNEITLFGMALFWQKATEIFTKFIIHFLTYRVERLFNSKFYFLALNSLQNLQFIFSHTEQNPYLTRNFTAYLFYRSVSNWTKYGLLGHRSLRS